MRSVISSAKASKILGWTPLVTFEEGLKQTVEFFKIKNEKFSN